MAGAGNVAATPATTPALVRKPRRSMARFLVVSRVSGGLLCCDPNDSTHTRPLHCGISGPSMSASGHKQTKRHHGAMSALPPKADKEQTCRDVRFVPKADICSAAKSINDVSAPALLCGPIGGHRFLRSVDNSR